MLFPQPSFLVETAKRSSLEPIVILLASLGYCYFLVSNLVRKGLLRVIFLLPLFYLFSVLPWYSSSSFLRGHISYFITWIASFKILLFCFNQGPSIDTKNFVDFFAFTIFPIKFKENVTFPKPYLALPKFVGLFILILLNLYMKEDQCSSQILRFSIIYGIYVLFTTGATWFPLLARYELVPLFNEPYLATSLQDFWGRRWNLYSSSILRQTIYYPTRNVLKAVVGHAPAKVMALLSTLVVSGIMHQVMFYYITCGKKPTGEVTLFFVVQAISMVFETALKKLFRIKGWNPVHPVVSINLTVGFVSATFYWLVVLPVQRSGQNDCSF